jgi:hypothetical protein
MSDVENDFKSVLLDVSAPAEETEEQRDRNTHYLLTAWKELLESRKKERATTLPARTVSVKTTDTAC